MRLIGGPRDKIFVDVDVAVRPRWRTVPRGCHSNAGRPQSDIYGRPTAGFQREFKNQRRAVQPSAGVEGTRQRRRPALLRHRLHSYDVFSSDYRSRSVVQRRITRDGIRR